MRLVYDHRELTEVTTIITEVSVTGWMLQSDRSTARFASSNAGACATPRQRRCIVYGMVREG
jgi:hypothetical protein